MYDCCEICGENTLISCVIQHSGAIVCEDCLPKEEQDGEEIYNGRESYCV